ncbi:MAG: acetate--CoA ligase family protein, partial [Acidimicrobiia bacterium]|nr:acetate--CoA ligase family protein [Acidimicrobiia bacterium]
MEGLTAPPLLTPSSVAVVGVSTDPTKAGYSLFENACHFEGSVVGIGRQANDLHGRPIVAGLDELSDPPDLAVLAIPPGPSVDTVQKLDRLGVGAAIVCAGGFAEASPDGAGLQRQLADIADGGSIRVLGPNTSGIVVPRSKLFCSFVPAVRELIPGPLGVVAQSGGVAHSIAFAASNDGPGVSAMVGVGNGADLRLAELVDMVGQLPDTKALVVHIEGVPDGTALLEVVQRLHPSIPVIALKAGRSNVDHLATSHTGALTGDWATAAAMLGDAGAVVVETQTDLIDAAKALTATRLEPMSRPGVGVVTGQAGPALLLVDRLQQLGIDVPPLDDETARRIEAIIPDLTHRQNPVDTGRPGGTFSQAALLVRDAPTIDLLVLFALLEPGAVDLPQLATEIGAGSFPTLLGTGGPQTQLRDLIDQLGPTLPAYDLPDRLARGVWAVCRDAERRADADATTPPATSHPDASSLPPPPLIEAHVKAVLAAVGVASPEHALCTSHAEAHAAFDRIEAPVVVKVAAASIAHKSRAGGVHLDITEPDGLQRALERIDASL